MNPAGTWRTERLLLRVLSADDASPVLDYLLHSRAWLAPWEPKRPESYWSLSAVAGRLEADHSATLAGRSLCLHLAENREPGRIIGTCNLRNIIRGAFLSCHLGYALAPDAVGRGFMTESINEIVRIAFSEMGLHRVEANVIPRNERSRSVLQRCGFVSEGVSPAYLCIAGTWEDHEHMVRLNHASSCEVVG